MKAGKNGLRAAALRKEAENLSQEAEALRDEAKELEAEADRKDAEADEAENDDVADDLQWAELRAASKDRRQLPLFTTGRMKP